MKWGAVVQAEEGQMSWRIGGHTCQLFRKVVSGGTCPWLTLKVIKAQPWSSTTPHFLVNREIEVPRRDG